MKNLLISKSVSIKQAMKRFNDVGEKEVFVVDDKNKLFGALSDGDVRKWILKEGSLDEPVTRICNTNPKYVEEDFQIEEVKKLMLSMKIECVPVIKKNRQVKEVLIWDSVFGGAVSKHKEILKVPVVIMAGGKGTRLDPFTKILPKSLIPIGDKPVVEIIMDKFNEYGVSDFYLSINHKSRMIKSYFEEMNTRYRITYMEENEPLGTAGSLKFLQKKIKGPLLVTNCDVVIECDYSELVQFHMENKYDLTLVVSCRHYVIPYGVCRIENGGILKNIEEKPEYDLLVNTGMYVLNEDILELIPENQFFNITDLIAKAKEKGLRVGAFPVNEKSWIDVGQWEEYKKAIKDFGLASLE